MSQGVHDFSHKDELEIMLTMSLDALEHMPYVLHDELVAIIESLCLVSSTEESATLTYFTL